MERPPTDSAEHAEDFSRRYADDLDILAGQVMMDLDIPDDQMERVTPTGVASTTAFSPVTERAERSLLLDRSPLILA